MIFNPAYTFLIGLPGSGKSTFAQQFIRENPHTCLVSTDIIRAQLFGDEAVQGDWSIIWNEVKSQFYTAYYQDESVIYDATNFRPLHRQELISTVRQIGFTSITAIWIQTPMWLCLSRNKHRQRQVPEGVILSMHRHLRDEPPHIKEGFDLLICLDGSKV